MKKTLSVILLIFTFLSIAGCGQKGPLIVEQPPLEKPTEPEAEIDPVK